MPFNPDIANAFFRCGYIETWGRGFSKMTTQCLSVGLPEPLYYYEMSGFWVVFRKDTYNEQSLKELGLNDRQVKAVLYVKENGKITNSEYQKINEIGKSVTIDELHDLVKKQILSRIGNIGRGTYYELPNQ